MEPHKREKGDRKLATFEQNQILPAGAVDKLSTQQLRELCDLLVEAKEEGTDFFGLTAFEAAMKSVLGDNVDDDEIKELFCKIDANSRRKITWTDLMDHIQQICNQRDASEAKSVFKPFIEEPKTCPCLQHDDVTVALKIYEKLEGHRDVTAGHYVSASTGGFLMIWSPDLELVAKLHIQHTENQAAKQSVTVTDMVCLADAHMIAVSTTVWDIRFYDSSPAEFEKHFCIVDFPFCVMTMDYRVEGDQTSLLLCGDTSGGVNIIYISEDFFHSLRRSQIVKQRLSRIPFVNIERKTVEGMEVIHFPSIHSNWVLKVKYIHTINCFLSCAACTKEAMALHDILKMEHYFFRSPKGILCFDFSHEHNFIISGGMDYAVKIWNPYVHDSPTCILQGHMSPVIHVMVDNDRHFIMSISKDKYIKIWHITLYCCLQTLNCSIHGLGKEDIKAAVFNPLKHTMIVATYQLAAFSALIVDDAVKYNTHSKPVCAALYNETFNVVITGGQDSEVIVWDLITGRKIFEFSKAHKVTRAGIEYPVEITAMRLDPTERRLVTAGKDGVVKIWNFNNGLCLNEFRTVGEKAITGIAFAGYHMFVAGWNRKVTLFYDDGLETFEKVWDLKHEDDILGIDTHRGQVLATASYDGEIIIWIRENGFVKFRLRDEGIVQMKNSENGKNEDDAKKRLSEEEGSQENVEMSKKGSLKSDFKTPEVYTKGKSLDRGSRDEESSGKSPSQQRMRTCSEAVMKLRKKTTLDRIMFLQNRPIAPDVATLVSCGKDGYIRMWSVAPGSGLLGKFHGPQRDNDAVLCMASDAKNTYLITGDTSGYVKVWQLEGYLDGTGKSPPGRLVEFIFRFPFLRLQFVVEERAQRKKGKSKSTDKTSASDASGGQGTKNPCLLNCFRAHLHAILHVEYVNGYDLVLSCGREGSVRMWTVAGLYIGAFGQKDPWDLNNLPEYPPSTQRPMPADVRCLASPTTFKVINNGACPRWSRAMAVFKHAKEAGVMCFPWVKELEKSQPAGKIPKPTIRDSGEPILGKYHVVRRKYHLLPKLSPLTEINHKVSVYHTFDAPPLEGVQSPVLSDYTLAVIRESGIGKKKKGRRKKSTALGNNANPKSER